MVVVVVVTVSGLWSARIATLCCTCQAVGEEAVGVAELWRIVEEMRLGRA